MTRSFYVVLGVPPTENPSGIRRAFRELALRYHPDRAGAQSTPYFQELVNAYRVLSDPLLRASYDEGLERAGEREQSAPEPFAQTRRPRPEPLGPRRRLSLFHDFDAHRPARKKISGPLRHVIHQPLGAEVAASRAPEARADHRARAGRAGGPLGARSARHFTRAGGAMVLAPLARSPAPIAAGGGSPSMRKRSKSPFPAAPPMEPS